MPLDGLKVFSATLSRDRHKLGETVTKWIDDHPAYEIVDKIVTQSSDDAFHCISVSLFYVQRSVA
jgi:folate-dependent tRNA-U54 methylase TrmFO/GidA